MKVLLDEQLSSRIAVLLRQAGYDVVAVAERDDLVGRSDRVMLEVAATEERAVITNNMKDFRPLAAERLAQGRSHGGLVLVPSRQASTRAAVAALTGAIERVLHDHPEGLAGSERWIDPL